MNVEDRLRAIRDLIQEDVGNRGLARDPADNLLTACPDDFGAACRSIAEASDPAIAVVTGFFLPHADPPAGETDGPLGAVFLARALTALGVRIAIVTDSFCKKALLAGLETCGLSNEVLTLPPRAHPWPAFLEIDWRHFREWFRLTHLVSVERVGPSHSPDTIRCQAGSIAESAERFEREVPREHWNCCHNMRGVDITATMSPAANFFEDSHCGHPPIATIGIGDGGNEIGMGKIRWDTIRRNIPNGGLIACRVPTDHLIVAGVSNWGAYALAAGVAMVMGRSLPPDLFDVEREREILRIMVEKGPLVDGTTGKPTCTVDGLSFETYAKPLRELGRLMRE